MLIIAFITHTCIIIMLSTGLKKMLILYSTKVLKVFYGVCFFNIEMYEPCETVQTDMRFNFS